MQTGCTGPFRHGTGGFCGCNCGCCPPTCYPVIAVYFDCGAPLSTTNPQGCVFSTPMAAWADLQLEVPIGELPEFSDKPIISKDKKFSFGAGVTNCSVPCETVCVELTPGGVTPICCLEIFDGQILAVGNGYVTAPTTVSIPGCLIGTVYINGQPPPVFVCDADPIVVTIVAENDCCQCQQIDFQAGLCAGSLGFAPQIRQKPLWKRKIDSRSGKAKINPRTGKPIIMIDKTELLRRIVNRGKKLRGRGK